MIGFFFYDETIEDAFQDLNEADIMRVANRKRSFDVARLIDKNKRSTLMCPSHF